FLLLLFVLLAGFVFTLNNSAPVPLWLGTTMNPKPLSVWMLLAFSAGGLFGLLLGLGLWQRFRMQREVRQLRTRLHQVEQERDTARQQAAAPPPADKAAKVEGR